MDYLDTAVNGKAIAVRWLDMQKQVAYHFEADLTELRVTRREDGWLVIIKATIQGKPKVSFVWAPSYVEALEMTVWYVENVEIPWKEDKYPPGKAR